MQQWLPDRPRGRVVVVGAGKAAASMAKELENCWGGPLEGLVVVPYDHSLECRWIRVIEAGHPIPDAASEAAATDILRQVSGLCRQDTVVCLLSGGGSALLSLPAAGVTMAEKALINDRLLRSGAPIHEINCVRKKLSAIKGGKLGAACAPAHVLTLLISDVPGNDYSMVASGPTVADLTSSDDALAILQRYGCDVSDAAMHAIRSNEPAKLTDSDLRVLATGDDAILAASAAAAALEITPYSLGDLAGDAAQLGEQHAAIATSIATGRGPIAPPCVVLSGGETTVQVQGAGRGGRNGQYALSLALALDRRPSIYAIAGDTDGIDGSGDNAGCIVTPDSLRRAARNGLDPRRVLQRNDSYRLFSANDDLIVTGPTRTNVNDFRAIYIGATSA